MPKVARPYLGELVIYNGALEIMSAWLLQRQAGQQPRVYSRACAFPFESWMAKEAVAFHVCVMVLCDNYWGITT